MNKVGGEVCTCNTWRFKLKRQMTFYLKLYMDINGVVVANYCLVSPG